MNIIFNSFETIETPYIDLSISMIFSILLIILFVILITNTWKNIKTLQFEKSNS